MSRTEPADPIPSLHAEVIRRQMALLQDQSPLMVGASLFHATLVTLYLFDTAAPAVTLSWYAIVVIAGVVRIRMAFKRRREPPPKTQATAIPRRSSTARPGPRSSPASCGA